MQRISNQPTKTSACLPQLHQTIAERDQLHARLQEGSKQHASLRAQHAALCQHNNQTEQQLNAMQHQAAMLESQLHETSGQLHTAHQHVANWGLHFEANMKANQQRTIELEAQINQLCGKLTTCKSQLDQHHKTLQQQALQSTTQLPAISHNTKPTMLEQLGLANKDSLRNWWKRRTRHV